MVQYSIFKTEVRWHHDFCVDYGRLNDATEVEPTPFREWMTV